MAEQLPVVDLAAYYIDGPSSPEAQRIIQAIHNAASAWGFFLLTGTAVSPQTQYSLLTNIRSFFDLPLDSKMALDVSSGGVAWRGYMPFGGEHTQGHIDWKEGLYFVPEHANDHRLAGLPLHGKNQFPDSELPGVRHAVLEYLEQVTELGRVLTEVFSLGLGLERDEVCQRRLKPEPVVLFRCFKYMPVEEKTAEGSRVGNVENGFGIDFGYLTILKADSPGLQVNTFEPNFIDLAPSLSLVQVLSPSNKWVDAPFIENSFIVNIGDMFDQLTWGHYRSRPHRVRRPDPCAAPRLSFPLFFDFAWNARMEHLPLDHLPVQSEEGKQLAKQRWATTTFRDVTGTWSQYLARKVQKVFPKLGNQDFEPNTAPSTRFTRAVEIG